MEYAVLISIIAAAFLAMYIYGQRGISRVIKSHADQIAKQGDSQDFIGSSNMITVSNLSSDSSGATVLNKTTTHSITEVSDFSTSSGDSTTSLETY